MVINSVSFFKYFLVSFKHLLIDFIALTSAGAKI